MYMYRYVYTYIYVFRMIFTFQPFMVSHGGWLRVAIHEKTSHVAGAYCDLDDQNMRKTWKTHIPSTD